jgi:PKD repeat protein
VFADAGEDRTVIVGADTMFRAQAYNSDHAAFRSARFVWNFGDGTSAEGAQVMHHFSYPGRYDVELYITNQNYSASSRVIVTATETAVAMGQLAGGGVSIRNLSDRDLDLSYWLVRQDTATFKLPEHSVVLKGEAINIDQATLGFAATGARLLYPNGAEAVQAAMPAASGAAAPAPAAEPESAPNAPAPLSAPADSDEPISMPGPAPEAASAATSATAQARQEPASADFSAAAAASGATIPLWTALAGLGGIMGLGFAGMLAARRRPVTREAAEEFTLEE